MMKVYLDNVIVSGLTRSDLQPLEMGAVGCLCQEAAKGMLTILTSRESWREQERTNDPAVRKVLKDSRGDIRVIQDDHRVLGFSNQSDQYGGFIAYPLISDIVDEALFADLKKGGLKDPDARHLMYVICDHCDIFATLDPDFIGRRKDLESMCRGLRILKPSELWAELSERRNLHKTS
jgi:predicted nucleic acid-binding protein